MKCAKLLNKFLYLNKNNKIKNIEKCLDKDYRVISFEYENIIILSYEIDYFDDNSKKSFDKSFSFNINYKDNYSDVLYNSKKNKFIEIFLCLSKSKKSKLYNKFVVLLDSMVRL